MAIIKTLALDGIFLDNQRKPYSLLFVISEGRGWMHHLFIYLFICGSNRIVVLLHCYHITALCTSQGDISASAIYQPWRVFKFIIIQVGLHWLLLQLRWSFLQSLFLSALFAATCSQPTTLRQLLVGMSIVFYCFRYSVKSLRITVVVDTDHLYLN